MATDSHQNCENTSYASVGTRKMHIITAISYIISCSDYEIGVHYICVRNAFGLLPRFICSYAMILCKFVSHRQLMHVPMWQTYLLYDRPDRPKRRSVRGSICRLLIRICHFWYQGKRQLLILKWGISRPSMPYKCWRGRCCWRTV